MNHPPIRSSVASDLAVVWCYVRENQAMTKTQFCCRLQKYFLFPLSSESSFFHLELNLFGHATHFISQLCWHCACPTTTTTTKKPLLIKAACLVIFNDQNIHINIYCSLHIFILMSLLCQKNPPSKPPLIYFFYLKHPLVAVPFGNPRSGRFSMHRSSVFFPHFVHWVVEVTWTLVRTFCSFFSKIFSSRSVQELQDI